MKISLKLALILLVVSAVLISGCNRRFDSGVITSNKETKPETPPMPIAKTTTMPSANQPANNEVDAVLNQQLQELDSMQEDTSQLEANLLA